MSAATPATSAHRGAERATIDIQTTTCCVAGAGPAGAVLALLLARAGIAVTLLEAHGDFDRQFRGDTLHPSTMELMDQLGLAGRLLELQHTEVSSVTLPLGDGAISVAPFRHLRTRFPFIAMLPQPAFLKFITDEAAKYPNFRLVMGARVEQLLTERGVVRGVRYQGHDGIHELRALLTVAADGRFSRIRKLADFGAVTTSPPIDVLWFRLPRRPSDTEEAQGKFRNGHFMIMLNRGDQWQCAYLIVKGTFGKLRAGGIEGLRRAVAETAPDFADRVDVLRSWKDASLLTVASDRLRRWYRPGLLLIGDAAHVMSPVGGVGINVAIGDAVAAANALTEPLRRGRVTLGDLAAVQRRRAWQVRLIQALQSFIQVRIAAPALDPDGHFRPPDALRRLGNVPLLNRLPGYFFAYGVWPERIDLRY